MERRKLLIAEGSEDFRRALAEALGGIYCIRTTGDGKEALELLRSFRPDILVLDLMLPYLDGISLLEAARNDGIRPLVLATSRLINDYVTEAAQRLEIGYLMRKPCDISATVTRVGDLERKREQPRTALPDARTHVSNILMALGIRTRLNGYRYLREGIILMAKKPGQSMTKELYPGVAAICGCKGRHVERSSRTAIESAWENRDRAAWSVYFAPGGEWEQECPSNGAFISRLADVLRLSGSSLE